MSSTNGSEPLEVHLSAADRRQLAQWAEDAGRTVPEVAAGVLHGGIVHLAARLRVPDGGAR